MGNRMKPACTKGCTSRCGPTSKMQLEMLIVIDSGICCHQLKFMNPGALMFFFYDYQISPPSLTNTHTHTHTHTHTQHNSWHLKQPDRQVRGKQHDTRLGKQLQVFMFALSVESCDLEQALKDAGAYSNDCIQKFSWTALINLACKSFPLTHFECLTDDRGSVNRRQFCPSIPRLFVAD